MLVYALFLSRLNLRIKSSQVKFSARERAAAVVAVEA